MLASAATPSTVHFELSDLHAHVYGNFAYVRGLGGIRSDDGKFHAKNRFTDILVYRDGRWQCVAAMNRIFLKNAREVRMIGRLYWKPV